MKVAALAHFALPFRAAGSEVVIHELLKAAAAAGHETVMWCTQKDSETNWVGREPDVTVDGVTIKRVRNVIVGKGQMGRWRPDVVVTHHDHATFGIKTARLVGARSVFLTHNDMDVARRPLQTGPDLVIHNSEWVAESLLRFGEPKQSMVFHPPLTPDRHKVDTTGDAITLVNLNEHKGAHLFYQLAERMPDHQFLGVVGGHGVQVVRHGLPNVTIADHNPDMRPVWSATRVLLMPSVYESYGLVAVEAGLNGIPTIANPTPGLLENLGKGGIFAGRDNPDVWVKYLEQLDDPNYYRTVSDYARTRADAAAKKTGDTLTRWVEWVG
jgi:glycosyltransferase involved in cell wall biosynthesis